MSIRRSWLPFLAAILPLFAPAVHSESFTITTPAGLPGEPPPPFTNGDGTNNAARFTGPAAIALDSAANLFITDGSAIRKVSLVGANRVVSTVAGKAWLHGSIDDTNDNARFNSPGGIAVDNTGTLFVADTVNNTIRRVAPFGTNWVVTTLAGSGITGSSDGTNSGAKFNHPYGIAAGNGGILYVADTANHALRKITPIGTNWAVTTIAGLAGTNGIGSADGTNSDARFNAPAAIAIDTATNIYVIDFGDNTVRMATPSGTNWIVTTLAGLAGSSGSADGTNKNARFSQPQGIAVDGAGNLYVSDSANNTIRKLRHLGTNWVVSTLAGLAGSAGSADGTGPAARFSAPDGVVTDAGGRLYIADAYNYTIRLGQVAALLEISRSASQLLVSWPRATSNYVLETSSALPNGPWSSVTSGIVASGDTLVLTTNASSPAKWFRLRKP